MAFTVALLVNPLGTGTGPFDLYSDVDNFQAPFGIVTQSQLAAGSYVLVPDNTTRIKLVSTGNCGNILFVDITGIIPTPSPTMTPTVTPTVTPSFTPTPTHTPTRSPMVSRPAFPSTTSRCCFYPNSGRCYNTTMLSTEYCTSTTVGLWNCTSATGCAPGATSPVNTCLVYNTPITMTDGTTKLIQDIQVGDKVLSISNKDKFFATNKFRKSTATITGTKSISVNNIIDINNGLLKSSHSHINVIKRDGIWSLKTSLELLVGDIMIDINKNEIKITSINIVYESQQVYNITVDKEHLYFANNILTHNKTAPPSNFP
jgi:hypothetical protein